MISSVKHPHQMVLHRFRRCHLAMHPAIVTWSEHPPQPHSWMAKNSWPESKSTFFVNFEFKQVFFRADGPSWIVDKNRTSNRAFLQRKTRWIEKSEFSINQHTYMTVDYAVCTQKILQKFTVISIKRFNMDNFSKIRVNARKQCTRMLRLCISMPNM